MGGLFFVPKSHRSYYLYNFMTIGVKLKIINIKQEETIMKIVYKVKELFDFSTLDNGDTCNHNKHICLKVSQENTLNAYDFTEKNLKTIPLDTKVEIVIVELHVQ